MEDLKILVEHTIKIEEEECEPRSVMAEVKEEGDEEEELEPPVAVYVEPFEERKGPCIEGVMDTFGASCEDDAVASMDQWDPTYSQRFELNSLDSILSKEASTQDNRYTQMEIHKHASISQNPFVCYICKKRFETKDNLLWHMSIHKGYTVKSLESMIVKEASTSQKLFVCYICEKRFDTKNSLRSHHTCTHTGNEIKSWEDFFSKEISTQESENSQVDIHKHFSSIQNQFVCYICDKRLDTKNDLLSHMRIHKGYELNYLDSLLIKEAFTQESDFGIKKDTSTNQKKFECYICEKCFDTKGNLLLHMCIHNGEKNFECSICLKAFTFKQTFKNHMRIHTGRKPFVCSVCKKSYSVYKAFQSHILVHSPGYSCLRKVNHV